MTDRLAVILALLVAALLFADYWFNDWAYALFLAKKTLDLTEYMAFWR